MTRTLAAPLVVRAPLRTLTAWWRGDLSLAEARSAGMAVQGRLEWVHAFPGWFGRYAFAAAPLGPQFSGSCAEVPWHR